jgi:hypothetical protein
MEFERKKMSLSGQRIVLVVLVLALLASTAQADRRSFVWSQEYQTMGKGEVEFEYYLTSKIDDLKKSSDKSSLEHQLELEYGVTDHLQMAIYQRFQHTKVAGESSQFDYTGSKIEGKYRIGEKGDLPLDTSVYVEYVRGEGTNNKDKMEHKLILSKDFGMFNVTYNQVIEHVVAKGNGTAYEYAAGLFYEYSPTWHFGIESTGNYMTDAYRLGPTVSWASQKYWVAAGLLHGLTSRTDDFRVRLIVGIPF